MNRKLAFVLIATLISATTAWANAGPTPLPKGRKLIEPPVRFVDVDKYPGHVFYLYYSALYAGNTTVALKEAEPIKLSFKRKDFTPTIYMQVMAVERTKFEEQKKLDPKLAFLIGDKDFVLTAPRLPPPEATVPENVKEVPVTTYRVEIKDGKLSASKVEPMKTGAAPPAGLAPPWVLGIAMSLSLAWFGVWFARRILPSPLRGRGAGAVPE